MALASIQVISTTNLPRTGSSPTSWRCSFSCQPTLSPRSPSSLNEPCSSGQSIHQTLTTASMSGGIYPSNLPPLLPLNLWWEELVKNTARLSTSLQPVCPQCPCAQCGGSQTSGLGREPSLQYLVSVTTPFCYSTVM